MTRNYIPGIDDEYKFTRPEYAKLLGISSNALRMKMRKGGFGDEYVIKDGKYLFKSETFNEIKRLTETLLPKVKLSHSQVVESAIRNCSREDNHEGNNATDRIQEKR